MEKRKSKKYFTLYLSLCGIIFFFLLTFSLLVFVSKTLSFDPLIGIRGWMWNAYELEGGGGVIGLGWTSLSCLNDFDNDRQLEYRCNPTMYGVEIVTSGDLDGVDDYVTGCAWSSGYGWVCFSGGSGSSFQCDSGAAPACAELSAIGVAILPYLDSGGVPLFYYLDSSELTGQTWVDLENYERAVILSLFDSGTPEKSYVGFPFTDDQNMRVDPADMDPNVIGCIGCSGNTCDACLNVSTADAEATLNPNPNTLCWECNDCTVIEPGGSCTDKRYTNSCLANSCTVCSTFTGVIVNDIGNDEYEMCGWAYHAYNDGGRDIGFGWIIMNGITHLGDIAYIDVQQGSILSRGDIYSPGEPPTGKYNAAYIIEASGDIINWRSESGYEYPALLAAPEYLTPESGIDSGKFSNELGSLDYIGLITAVETGLTIGPDETYTNKYGSQLYGSEVAGVLDPGFVMNDSVVYFANNDSVPGSGPITLSEIEFVPGTTDESGAGIIVVDDDLVITGNIYYSQTPVDALKHIPSIVWIVNGDVTVNIDDANNACSDTGEACIPGGCSGGTCSIHNIAGTFIILGDGGSDCPPNLDSPSGSCGRFTTGSGNVQLRIHGAVLAKQIKLERFYGAGSGPSEFFVPDGRLQANPPSGLTDFSKSVPRFITSN